MKTLILILILASFMQAAFLPINLVLIILICRSYLKAKKNNLFLAFAFGIFTSHLELNTLGIHSLVYLVLIGCTQMLSKSIVTQRPASLFILVLILLSIEHISISLLTRQPLSISPIVLIEKSLFEAFSALPIFYLIRLWEERFVIPEEVKLKF